MADARILVIDDESDIRRLIGIHLQEAGMQYTVVKSGNHALTLLKRESFDLIVLDLMMDDTDGFEVLKHIRIAQNHTPVIIVSAVNQIGTKIETLGLGADDYVTKPFIPGELIARIEANIRRSRHSSPILESDTIQCAPIHLNVANLVVNKYDDPYLLSQTESELLAALMRFPGRTFTKEELYQAVWKHDHFDANNLSVYINYLRKKIEDDPKSPQYIKTVRGIGYRFQGAE